MEQTVEEDITKAEAQGNTPVGIFVPPTSEGVYTIVKMKDGNYTGYIMKKDKLVTVRDIGPETVLQLLLTHDGN